MLFKEKLKKLQKLSFPIDEFAIFGSGPLVIRKIRDAHDIDILVKESLWKKLIKKYPKTKGKNKIEIYKDWPYIENVNLIIDNSDIINGLRFVKLKYVLIWKKFFKREKDIKDIKLIEKWQKKNKT